MSDPENEARMALYDKPNGFCSHCGATLNEHLMGGYALNDQPKSKATTPNPKDLFGSAKVSLTKFPATALAHGAHAFMDGVEKYGAYNWRDKPVIASIYVDAAVRHILDWFEGQQTAVDSGVHHLGHVLACAAILIDAEENGVLIDDRPVFNNPDVLDKLLERLSAIIVKQRAAKSFAPNAASNFSVVPQENK